VKKRRTSITAAELFAQQANDPDYQAMRAARDRELAKIADERRREQGSLLADLERIGVAVDWVGRLLSIPVPDERIYPILLDHIGRPYSPWLLDWIGCAFGHKSARPTVWDRLILLLKSHTLEESAASGVLNAISDIARPDDLPALIHLLSDPLLGSGRSFLVGNLMRSKKQEARAALMNNRDDPDLAVEIGIRLARSRR